MSYVAYDVNGNVERAINARNFTHYFTFDSLDRRTHVKDPVHLAVTYVGYDAVGNSVSSVDQQGNTVYMTYDRLNRANFVHDHRTGLLTYHAWDAVGNRTDQQLLLGAGGSRRSTYWQYDQANRTIKVIAPDTGASYFVYDAANNQTRAIDPRGRPVYMAYDELNRLRCRFNVFQDKTYINYDARGSVTKQIDGEGRTAYFGFDAAGRLFHQSNALGEFSYFFYDARGNRTKVVNPRGYGTYFRFDLLGRPTHREHALGGVAYMGYDQVGNKILNLDELGNPTYFAFDGLSRQTHVADGLLNITYAGYDSRSSLVLRTDGMGRATYMGHDAAGRRDKQWFANPVETADSPSYFIHNAASEITTVDDRTRNLGVAYYDYDSMGRRIKKTTISGAVYYEYDLSGLRLSLKDPGLAKTYYVYDSAARPERVLLDSRPVYFVHDKSGLLTRRLLPGGEGGLPHRVMAYHFYDGAGRTLRIENRGSDWSTLINYFHYERNQNGFPTRIRREDSKNLYYQWDALDRLHMEQQLTGASVDRSDYYTYDSHGNKTSKLSSVSGTQTDNSYDLRNLIVKSHTIAGATNYYDFDASRRMLSRRITDGSSSSYFVHDQLNNMLSVQILPPNGAIDVFQLGYNGVGERVAKRDATVASAAYLAWDGTSEVLTERTAAGVVAYRYRYTPTSGGMISKLSEFDPTGFGTPKQLVAGDKSVRKLLQDGGAAFSYFNYDAFGGTRTFVTGSGLTPEYHLRFLPDAKYNCVTFGDLTTGSPGEENADQAGTAGDVDMQRRLRDALYVKYASSLAIPDYLDNYHDVPEADLFGPDLVGFDQSLNPVFATADEQRHMDEDYRFGDWVSARYLRLRELDEISESFQQRDAAWEIYKLQTLNNLWLISTHFDVERKLNYAAGAVGIGTSLLPIPLGAAGGKALAFGLGGTLGAFATSSLIGIDPNDPHEWMKNKGSEVDWESFAFSLALNSTLAVLNGGVRGWGAPRAPVPLGSNNLRNALTVSQDAISSTALAFQRSVGPNARRAGLGLRGLVTDAFNTARSTSPFSKGVQLNAIWAPREGYFADLAKNFTDARQITALAREAEAILLAETQAARA